MNGNKSISIQNIRFTGYFEDSIFGYMMKKHTFFEYELLKRWSSVINGGIVIDVGANLGNHSIYWAVNSNAQKIYAFEPYFENYKLLEENIMNNSITKIVPINQAVNETNGFSVLRNQVTHQNLGNASFILSEKTDDSVKTVSLDSFIQEFDLNGIDLIKIDSEGSDCKIIQGMKKILEQEQTAIWIESEPSNVLFVCEFLADHKYQLSDCEGMNLLFLPEKKNKRMNLKELLKKYMQCYSDFIDIKCEYEMLLDKRG